MEFKDTMKNARKKLESSMDSAMPCKIENLGQGETCGTNIRESALERLNKKIMKITLLERVQVKKSLQSCAQIYSYP